MVKLDLSEVGMDIPFPVYFAIGLPQGLRIDPEKGNVMGGTITCAGQRVSIDPTSYTLWLLLQLTFSEKQLQEKFRAQMGDAQYEQAMRTLTEKKLVGRLGSKKDLKLFESLRVIPKATGIGNEDKEKPLRYTVRPNFGDKEVILNPFDYAVWMAWDGKMSVMESWKETAKLFKIALPSILPREVGILFVLMSQGLLNLDFV